MRSKSNWNTTRGQKEREPAVYVCVCVYVCMLEYAARSPSSVCLSCDGHCSMIALVLSPMGGGHCSMIALVLLPMGGGPCSMIALVLLPMACVGVVALRLYVYSATETGTQRSLLCASSRRARPTTVGSPRSTSPPCPLPTRPSNNAGLPL